MFIYKLEPTEKGRESQDYDCYNGHVVASNSSTAARTMVPTGGEGEMDDNYVRGGYWTDPELSTCVVIGQANVATPRVVLSSYRAG